MVPSEDHRPQEPKRWTVMLYMAASLNEGTEQAAIRDLEELERITENPEVNARVNLLVQIDRRWPGYAERYCIENGKSKLCESLYGMRNVKADRDNPDENSGNLNVLREFVKWGRGEAFKAEHYMIVLWGHQYGLGFGRDHGDPLRLPEIENALKGALDGKRIDILGANACAMSYVEAAYQLRNVADFLVSPEIAMPLQGWPYDKVLAEIVKKPEIDAKEFGEAIVQQFMDSFTYSIEPRSVSLTLLDLTHAEEMKEFLVGLASALTAAIYLAKNGAELKEHITDAFLDTAHGDERPLIDLADLCERLNAIDVNEIPMTDRETAQAIKEMAQALRIFLESGGFIAKSKASPGLDGINGLGIFAPSVTGVADLMRLELSKEEYKKLDLAEQTGWANLVYQGLKKLLDPVDKVVAELANGMSATSREDRFGIAGLLVSIHRAFARLEKALVNTQNKVGDVFNGNGSSMPLQATTGNPATVQTASSRPNLYLARDRGYSPSGGALAATASTVAVSSSTGRLLELAPYFEKLEQALANAERIVKKVTTHPRLGLGVPKTDMGVPKTDMGVPKTDMGVPKTDMGIVPWGSNGGGANPGAVATSDLIESFRQIAHSLKLVEEALARAENEFRLVIRDGSEDGEYMIETKARLDQSLGDLHEAVSSAKITIMDVLTDPGSGLGPPPQHRERVLGRQELALRGGLSSQGLRLLARPSGPTVSM